MRRIYAGLFKDFIGKCSGEIMFPLDGQPLHLTSKTLIQEVMMFIAQPVDEFGRRFCEELCSMHAGHRRWHTAEFAVAWVNESGLRKVFDSLREFLSKGGRVRVTVGLDFGRTSFEGLQLLLELEREADMSTHVFFDENPACTFHPKVFFFRNDDEACLIVGSNNMTGAGLETNIEAALRIVGPLDTEALLGASEALQVWRDDVGDLRIRRLTPALLMQLRERRYVLTEEDIRSRRREDEGPKQSAELPLFGRSSLRPLRPGNRARRHKEVVGRTTGSLLGEVLLMRVRPRRNGKQIQISMKILEASFMHGVQEVVSTDGTIRPIGYNMARGIRNTARFEAPELGGMKNPVARFQWVVMGAPEHKPRKVLQYEVFDANVDSEGRKILKKLEDGISIPPLIRPEDLSQEETVLSISDSNKSQWYRLDSA